LKEITIIIEKHPEGYTAYPLPGQIDGAVVGQGDTYEEALADIRSAIEFHIETFGPQVLQQNYSLIEASISPLYNR
jgi:predicted RNase H-like HicB family nuclease